MVAVPDPTCVVQELSVYIFTFDPGSAYPEIVGELLLAGDVGDNETRTGLLGAKESSTKVTDVEEQ